MLVGIVHLATFIFRIEIDRDAFLARFNYFFSPISHNAAVSTDETLCLEQLRGRREKKKW